MLFGITFRMQSITRKYHSRAKNIILKVLQTFYLRQTFFFEIGIFQVHVNQVQFRMKAFVMYKKARLEMLKKNFQV